MKKLGLVSSFNCQWCFVLAVTFLASVGFAQFYNPIDPVFGPEVRITSPPNHAVYHAPVDIPIFAYIRSDLRYTNLEFYAGATKLGVGNNLGSTNRPVAYANFVSFNLLTRLGSMYCFVWTNAPAGSYALTAVARGFSSPVLPSEAHTSAPVNITIISTTNSTNPTDMVSIVATDPIAVMSTNVPCIWPGITNATPAWTNWPPAHWQYFTNWGPKNGLFTVRRMGNAAAAINVNYAIGGTASNGVNYAQLPGFVTIPAGAGYGLIPVVPVDTGTSSVPRTVVLTLTASSNSPADYVVGQPSRAAGLIVYTWPRPLPWAVPDGSFHVNASGPDGAWFIVENSTNLLNWTPVYTNQVFQGSINFVDPNAAGSRAGYYRTIPLTNTPSQ